MLAVRKAESLRPRMVLSSIDTGEGRNPMRRLSIFVMVTMLGVATMAGAQQDELDPVQQAMLEKVRAAVEQQNSWEQYRLFTVTTSRMAWTVTGDDTADW